MKFKSIQHMMDYLNEEYLDMLDAAVEKSNLAQAKELIEYIKNKE